MLTRVRSLRRRPRERALIEASGFFDADYYLDLNPDVAAAGVDPLLHFVSGGWREGRNPHPLFDTRFYLDQSPDVVARGLNPLAHFVEAGLGEGRLPKAGFEPSLSLPLPPSAWEAGSTAVERFLRTFVLGRGRPASDDQVESLIREVQGQLGAVALDGIPEATVIVPVFNQLKLTLWCLYATLASRPQASFEVLVVDDASTDGTAAALARLAPIRSVRAVANQGFVKSCLLGAEQARGRVLVFLNNDTLPLDGWLDALLGTLAAAPAAGAVGAKLLYPDGRLQEAGGIVWQQGSAWNYGRGADPAALEFSYRRGVDFCSGAALAVPAALFREAGGFDLRLAPAYGEDLDLALRLRQQGRTVLYQPAAQVVHLEGATSGTSVRRGVKAYQVRNLELLGERWRPHLRAHRTEGRDVHLEKDRDAERRVLFADAFTPRPDADAGSLDALHWMRALTELGFQVTFLPCFDLHHAGRYTEALQREGVECLHEGHISSPAEFVAARGHSFDLCVFYRFQVAEALLPVVRRHAPQARRLLALCDLSHVRLQRQATISGSRREARRAREARLAELLTCTQCDALWTPSAWEKDLLSRELPDARVFSWPLAGEVRAPRAPFAERRGIGFVGSFRHAPNVDAVLFFVREVLPLVLEEEPGLMFHVAGSHVTPEIGQIAHPNVVVHGQVDDLSGFFEQVRGTVAPLRFGAGMKGKIVASLSAGVPVVGTTLALEGMDLADGEGALVADEPLDFARALLRLYREPETWARLSQAGFARAARDYSPAAGTLNLARALGEMGLATASTEKAIRRAEGRAVSSASSLWAGIGGLSTEICHTAEEYRRFKSGPVERARRAFEERLLEDSDHGQIWHGAFSIPGQAPVMVSAEVAEDATAGRRANWREELVCPITHLNNRQRAVAALAQRLITSAELGVNDIYLTEQVTPLFRWISDRFRTVSITGSEFLGRGLAAGTTRAGVLHQDLEQLGFGDASFDVVLSCDVLEHVNEPRRALAELARVVRPGGHLLFTVPFVNDLQTSRRRARDTAGGVELLAEPCYHGHPTDPAGSLAYFDYGWDLLEWVAAAGFTEVAAVCYWSDGLGHLGDGLEVFHARR